MTAITITLNQIKSKSPCADGWKKVLSANGGTKADLDKPFPLSSILDRNGLEDTLWTLQCLPEYNWLWRKFAVWCARQVEYLMKDQRSKNALAADQYIERGSQEMKVTKLNSAELRRLATRVQRGILRSSPAEWMEFREMSGNPRVILSLLDQCDGLLAQHARDSTTLRELCRARDDARKERDADLAELEACREDAGRYRWLRENWFKIYGRSMGENGIIIELGEPWNVSGLPAHVDYAIDYSISREQSK